MSMKLKQKRKNPKKLIIIICIIIAVLILGAGTAYLLIKRGQPTSNSDTNQNIDYSEPTEDQKKAGEEANKTSGEKEEVKEKKPAPSPSAPPQDRPAAKKPTSVTITSMLQDEAGVLRIRTVIEAMETEGTCTLTVTRGGASVFTASAKSESRSSYATCQGFDVTRAQLGGAGQVSITIRYTGTIYEGAAAGEVTVQ